MSRKPPGHSWSGFTEAQGGCWTSLITLGNNGWARNPQSEELMPKVLNNLLEAGLGLERIRDAMGSLGYDNDSLHQLDHWESKRTTGKFG
ncbi:hypothetical protein, partial [Amycolatopsis thermoflava]